MKTTRLIGRVCKRSNALSLPILIGRRLVRSLERLYTGHEKRKKCFEMILGLYCAVVSVREGHSAIPVTKAKGIHLFSFRTQKLSPSALMVLGWTRPGRVGRRRLQVKKRGSNTSLFLCSAVRKFCRIKQYLFRQIQ